MLTQRKNRKALLYSACDGLMMPIPALLSRAGFEVHVISTFSALKKHRYIDQFILADSLASLIESLENQLKNTYDFIACCGDDFLLKAILHSHLSNEKKLRLLPVVSTDHFPHLGSKIGLSTLLFEKGIQTPAFRIANNYPELIHYAAEVGFPLFIKDDTSCGGTGIKEYRNKNEIKKSQLMSFPALIQKKIPGKLITSGGLFIDKKPIFFEIAQGYHCSLNGLGPCAVRRYQPVTENDLSTYQKVCDVAEAIGANGFVNLTWIETQDGELYFIEADMRPNVWVEHAKYFQEDPANKIKRFFQNGATLSELDFIQETYPKTTFAYPPRLKYYEILLNKYQWRDHFTDYYGGSYLVKRTWRGIRNKIKLVGGAIKNAKAKRTHA